MDVKKRIQVSKTQTHDNFPYMRSRQFEDFFVQSSDQQTLEAKGSVLPSGCLENIYKIHSYISINNFNINYWIIYIPIYIHLSKQCIRKQFTAFN